METHLREGELVFGSYFPIKLKKGMQFLSKITVGLIEPEYNFFRLDTVPEDEEAFMVVHGAPIHLFVIGEDGLPLADAREIGWFDPYDDSEEPVQPITDEEINIIINEHDGQIDIACDADGNIEYLDNKIIISYRWNEEVEE